MIKCGCVLIDEKCTRVALVYRKIRDDYSFPKGHLEENETYEECAIRETIEETGRECRLYSNKPISIMNYENNEGEIDVYMYLAIDCGVTSKFIKEEDKEELVWVDFNKVNDYLSYDNLKEFWDSIKDKILEIMN